MKAVVLVYSTGNIIRLSVNTMVADDVLDMYISYVKEYESATNHVVLVDSDGKPSTVVMFDFIATMLITDED